MEQTQEKPLKSQTKPVKTNLVLKDMLITDPAYTICPNHMPLKYLCEIDKQENEDHKGHQVKDLSEPRKIVNKKRKELQRRKVEWDRQYQTYDGLLEKRKNEELDMMTGLFDELETIIKQRKLDLLNKVYLSYEHEKNRREDLYSEKSQVRQTLRRNIEEYKKDFHTDVWKLLHEDIDLKQFEINVELENRNILRFNKLSDTVNSYLKASLKEQCLMIDTVDFPQDELMFCGEPQRAHEIADKISSLKITSHFTFIAENGTLKIVLDSKLNEDCSIEIQEWKDIKSIEFCFKELEFDKDDLLTLHYLFSQLKTIQSIKLTQEEEKNKNGFIGKNESLFTEFMELLFGQPDLQGFELNIPSNECSERVLRSLIDSRKALKKFSIESIDYTPYSHFHDFFKYLWQILSIHSETLEAAKIDLSRISVNHLFVNQVVNLPNLKSFVLAIDCGKNIVDKRNINIFIISSLQSMKCLEHLDITLFSCNLKDKIVCAFFAQAASIKTLTNLSFVIKDGQYDSGVSPDLKDSINMCGAVSWRKKDLGKMSSLSELRFGYNHDVKNISSRQEIKKFINECERKWRQFKESGVY